MNSHILTVSVIRDLQQRLMPAVFDRFRFTLELRDDEVGERTAIVIVAVQHLSEEGNG